MEIDLCSARNTGAEGEGNDIRHPSRAPVHATLARDWLGQRERSTSEPAPRANAATKGLDRNNKIRPEKRGSLSTDRSGFERKEVAHPNPTAKATVLEGEMIGSVATQKLVINN
jgi:hypothetical protein